MNEELKRGLRYVEPFVTIVGAWPLGPESATFLKILQPFIAPICFFLVSFSIWPGFYYIFFKERDGKRRLKMILPVFHSMFQLAQYIVVLSKMKNIRMVLDDIRNDWFDTTEENRQFFRECTKVGNKIMSILVIGVMGGGIGFRIILPLLKGRIVLPDNTTIRLLPCPIYLPFINDQVTPYYEIIFTLQALSGICNYTILISTNAIILMISLHMCGLIRILRKKMTDFTEKSIISEMSIQRNIVTIVEHHTKIKIFLSNGQTITEYICFLALANIVFLMCLLGYCVTLVPHD
ncbi:hypothetical protein E2986_02486 [Frieseomelitta varia]|uniref:Odorant receptor n=1 Tax=Frieseomelitta varia TaxID=561572 RepID=A0A833VTL2_9HYME|nr:hypothetical protein E2986_02486 [Frieseomelitta varia]